MKRYVTATVFVFAAFAASAKFGFFSGPRAAEPAAAEPAATPPKEARHPDASKAVTAPVPIAEASFPVAEAVAKTPAEPVAETAPAAEAKADVKDEAKVEASSEGVPPISAAGRIALSRWKPAPRAVADPRAVVNATPPAPLSVEAVRSIPLRDMAPLSVPEGEEADKADGKEKERHPEPIRPNPPQDDGGPDLARQTSFGPIISAPSPTGVSFEGVGVGLSGFVPSSNPPDTNGRVGALQYVQWNNTSLAVWDKTGNLLLGPVAGNTLFQSLGGACASHNDGDPTVAYDILSGRWILAQFVVGATPNYSHECVAVSQTQDATGAYYLYDFVTDAANFVDYPKIGVWPDGYYMTAHVFNAAGTAYLAGRVYVFERTQMLQGLTARVVSANLPAVAGGTQYGFLPSDLDSPTAPPSGAPAFIVGPDPKSTTRIDATRATVAWGATPSLTLSGTTRITVTSAGNAPCTDPTASMTGARDCVPEPAPATPTDYLDNLGFHFMYRLPYRNFGGAPVQESLVANTTGSGTGGTHSDIRWYELRNAGGTGAPTVFQTGTYDPDTDWRWMGSIAMDKNHDIALGYSKSSTTTIPGIYMTGRLGTDAAGTMGAEATVMAGIGVQTAGGNRWGDYSAMTLDPVDQCTFWYTNEYLPTNGEFNWATRIASYKFPSCTTSPTTWGTLDGQVTSCATGAPLSGVIVSLNTGYAAATDASGHYSIFAPAGSYVVTAADAGRNCTSSTPSGPMLPVLANDTVTQNFCMTGTSNLQLSGGVTIDDSVSGNGNGVINANECVDLNLAVANNGCANETAITAVLSTTTPGVTITQANGSYGTLAIDASGTSATPYKIRTSNTFVCGTPIALTLNLTYASGMKSLGVSVPTCAGGPNQTIPMSSIALSDPTQTDRIGRDGNPSACSGKACPGGIGTAGVRNYRTFSFTNTAGAPACITVTINAACGSGGTSGDIESAAYLTTYNPAALCTNYLGDSGISGLGTTAPSGAYSFQVPAMANFVVVVNTNAGNTTCTQFSGTVSGFYDLTPGPAPPTPTVTPGGPTTFCAGGSVTLTSSSATGNQWYKDGNPIPMETNQQLVVTTSGSYTVVVGTGACASAPSTPVVVTVNSIPSTPTATNGGPYCEGQTVQLNTPTVSGATYAWTGPNGFTSSLQNPMRTSVTTLDAGTYSVTVTVNGCTSAAGTTNVVVNATPATPTPTNGGPYCEGATIQLSTTAMAGATYAWTGPNGFMSSQQNPMKSNATTLDAGTYSVTVTVNGCTSAAGTTNVVVNATPATPAPTNGGPYCEGATIQLSTTAVAGATYAWTGPNGFMSNQQNPTKSNATTLDAGTYSLTVTVNGCTSAAGTTDVVVTTDTSAPTVTPPVDVTVTQTICQ